MSMLKEFREFAMKGNVMDLAVGVIIGGASGKIVDSVVADRSTDAQWVAMAHQYFEKFDNRVAHSSAA